MNTIAEAGKVEIVGVSIQQAIQNAINIFKLILVTTIGVCTGIFFLICLWYWHSFKNKCNYIWVVIIGTIFGAAFGLISSLIPGNTLKFYL